MTYEFGSRRSKINLWETYDKLKRNFRFFVNWAAGQKSDLFVRIGDPIFCNRGIACVSEYIFAVLAIYLVRMRRNNVNYASGQKTAITIDFIG